MTARGPRVPGLATVALALLTAEMLVVIVTGDGSLLPGGRPVGTAGTVWRLLLLGAALVWRFAGAARRDAAARGRVLLALAALPALAQFHLAGARLGGDGVMYYVYVRSLLKDADVDFANEYTHYELIAREDLRVPTTTGHRRSIFAVGPALLWAPWFALGEGIARLESLGGRPADLSGYGPAHLNAVALGSFLYGLGTVLLVHATLLRHFRPPVALLAAALVWLATFLHWYMVHQPTMAHAPSAFMAALVVSVWDRTRARRTVREAALLGLLLGLAMCVRWQNGLLLALPGLDLARAAWRRMGAPVLSHAGALALGTAAGALPQMLAWSALYGRWLLPYPPHGADFVRLDHPFLLQTLFSSRHGLLSWTPVLWAGYLGFLPLLRRRPALAGPLVVPLLFMTYLNACSGDWWAGGSFSNRRFDSLLPVLAFGLATALDVMRTALARRPQAAVAAVVLAVVLWNGTLTVQARRGVVPADDTVEFARLAGAAAALVGDHLGSPQTWPASWLFAWRHGRPPAQYDLLVGRYLFYRQSNLGGVVDLGGPGDEALLGEGWGPPAELPAPAPPAGATVGVRALLGRARLLVALDGPEDLEMALPVFASPGGTVLEVTVNGHRAGGVFAGSGWSAPRLRVNAPYWRRELNDVVLEARGSPVLVDAVTFLRLQAPPGEERGSRVR